MDPVSPKSREALALGYQTVPYEKPKLDQWNYLGKFLTLLIVILHSIQVVLLPHHD